MLNPAKRGLIIFDAFEIDFNLQKWISRMADITQNGFVQTNPKANPHYLQRIYSIKRGGSNDSEAMLNLRLGNAAFSDWALTPMSPIAISGTNGGVAAVKKQPWYKRLFKDKVAEEEKRLKEIAGKANFEMLELRRVDPPPPEITASEFFQSVKNTAEQLTVIEGRLKSYEDACAYLLKSGQTATLERMCVELEMHRAETQLFALGNVRCITEDQVIDFAKKAPRQIRIDWIKNFARLIPTQVTEAKLKLDELCIFDNYVIMHYDATGKGSLETTKETETRKAKEKDPILFGVICGSTKLYYVADWQDEFCDLTFDKIVETLGADAITANDISATIQMPTEKPVA